MKNVGIVRRLDELGRVVIPREFRKMHRINVGDPLEIFAMENGNIVISKFDRISDLVALGETACSSLSSELSMTVAVSSFESFVAATGSGKSEIIDKEIGQAAAKLLKNRSEFNGKKGDAEIGKLVDTPHEFVCVVPIQSYDDCFGGLFAFSDSEISGLDAAALRLAGKLVGDALAKY